MQVAVITGAASGIGAALAQEAVARGMHVVLSDRDAARLQATADALGPQALAVPCDVTDYASVQVLAERTYAAHGQVDFLFNNAGVLHTGSTWELPLATWQQAWQVNVQGVVHGVHAFVPRLMAAQRPAHIINTASMGGFVPSAMLPAYSATKAAVVALTESLLGELAQAAPPLKVSLLAPGPVHTALFDDPQAATARTSDYQAWMRDNTAKSGMPAAELARLTWDAVLRGDYWILTHPQMFDMLWNQRNQRIAARTSPLFQWTPQTVASAENA